MIGDVDREPYVLTTLKDCGGRHLGMLSMSSGFLLAFGRKDMPAYKIVENPLPDDAVIVGALVNTKGDITLVIDSSEYPPYQPGGKLYSIPEPVLCVQDEAAGWERGARPESSAKLADLN